MNAPILRRLLPKGRLSAAWLNTLAEAVERVSRLRAEAPLELIDTPGGRTVRLSRTEEIWAQITGGTNPYDWTEAYPDTHGTFSNGFRSGTTVDDPAYEAFANAGVPAGVFVRMTRGVPSGEWLFSFGSC